MIIDIVHSLINIFAGGRSEVKILLFFIYIACLGVVFALVRNYFYKTFKWRWFGVTLCVTYLYGLLLHIFYALSNSISPKDFFITGNNGEISSSTLWHSHIAKGAVGQIFAFFGKTQLATMDAGGAYVGLVPSWVLLVGSILIGILLLQALLYFATSFKIFLENKNKRQKIFLVLGYIIISFSLIKTSIDGGVFNPSFFVGILFILLFILREKDAADVHRYYVISFMAIGLLFFSLYIDSLQYGDGLVVAVIAALILLYTIFLYGSEEHIRLQFLVPLVILFVAGWWVASSRDRDIHDYSSIVLSKGQQVYMFNDVKQEVESFTVAGPESISDMSEQMNKNISYMPIAVPGVTCMAKAPRQEFSVELLSLVPVYKNTFTPSHFIEIKSGESIGLGKKWKTMLTVFVDPCLPEFLSVVDGELQKSHINNYLLVNPLFYDSSNDY